MRCLCYYTCTTKGTTNANLLCCCSRKTVNHRQKKNKRTKRNGRNFFAKPLTLTDKINHNFTKEININWFKLLTKQHLLLFPNLNNLKLIIWGFIQNRVDSIKHWIYISLFVLCNIVISSLYFNSFSVYSLHRVKDLSIIKVITGCSPKPICRIHIKQNNALKKSIISFK